MNTQYRKKPVVIDAVQFTPDKPLALLDSPSWLINAINDGSIKIVYNPDRLLIDTLEGRGLTASAGDWIIKGVEGELYPCKPDIFEKTYDPA